MTEVGVTNSLELRDEKEQNPADQQQEQLEEGPTKKKL
jgi:hypothetical protein